MSEAPTLELSLHVLYEGVRGDLERFLRAFADFDTDVGAELVVVDPGSADGDWLEDVAERYGFVRTVHLDRDPGWAAARNAGLKISRGRLVALADLSLEPLGPIGPPLVQSFDDPSVGLAGPFGLVSDDLREWRESDGPEVDAIEGYLLATTRALLSEELLRERFTWYRNADLDFSMQVRARGLRAVVVPLPVRKHAHRGWEALGTAERDRRSRKNFATFYERWKDRRDLLLTGRPPSP